MPLHLRSGVHGCGGGFEPPAFWVMRSDSPFDESRIVPSSTRDARHPVSTASPRSFGIALSLARRRFHRLIFRHIAAPGAEFAKARRRCSFQPPGCIRFCHSCKAAIMSSLNPLHARGLCGNSADWTYRTTRYSVNAIPTSRTHPAFGVSFHSDLDFLIGQPSDSRRADPFSKQLAPINETSVGNDDPNQPYFPCCVRQMVGHSPTCAIHALSARGKFPT